jgi:hypothetical protein
MTHPSAAAIDMARRLWTEASAGAATAPEMAAAAERLCAGLHTGLVRWIGSEGLQSLFLRSLAESRPAHSWLTCLRWRQGLPPAPAPEETGHGPADVADAMVALTGMLIHLLGRITGEDMATRLVENAWISGSRTSLADDSAKGSPDG